MGEREVALALLGPNRDRSVRSPLLSAAAEKSLGVAGRSAPLWAPSSGARGDPPPAVAPGRVAGRGALCAPNLGELEQQGLANPQ